ncbi:MAG TPA: hypothetical protein VML55_26380, partial [Planctomycetaceae bacterium]|nr:hypothetical protein [Planctomycetaceae bacterium]
LVRESGVRPITEAERLRGARYSDYLTTDSGKALLPPSDGWFRWWWLGALGVMAAAGWLMMKAWNRT